MKRIIAVSCGFSLLVACSGSNDAQPDSSDSSAMTTDVVSEAPTTTLAPLSELEYLTASVDPLWSTTANDDFAGMTLAQTAGGDTIDVATRMFGQPFDVPLPDDVMFFSGTHWITKSDDGTWNSWSQIDYATMVDVETLEAAVNSDFKDANYVPGVRVESIVGDGVKIVSLNFPATEDASAQGWETMTISIGPELDGLDPTGRNAVTVRWEQNVETLNEILVTPFLRGWLSELPIPKDVDVAEFHATTYNLSTTTLDIEASFTTSADRFDELADFFAEERISGALVLEGYTLPPDMSIINELDFGFFPMLADNDLTVEITRDLDDSSAPMNIRLGVSMQGMTDNDF
jgi:hypothetical protein